MSMDADLSAYAHKIIGTIQMYRFKFVTTLMFCFFLCACSEDGEHSPQSVDVSASSGDSAPVPLPVYKIVSDDYLASFKRTVEVQLPERTSSGNLKRIAEKIKLAASKNTDRTFIVYRLDDAAKSGYWATTHYDPDVEVVMLGMPEDQYSKAIRMDLLKDYPALVGSWINEGGGLSSLMVLYKKKDELFMDSLYEGDEKLTQKVRSVKGKNGALKIIDPDLRDEFYMLTKNGGLEFWGVNGKYNELLPRQLSEINLNIVR